MLINYCIKIRGKHNMFMFIKMNFVQYYVDKFKITLNIQPSHSFFILFLSTLSTMVAIWGL